MVDVLIPIAFSIYRTVFGPSFRHKNTFALTLDLVKAFICSSARSYLLHDCMAFYILSFIQRSGIHNRLPAYGINRLLMHSILKRSGMFAFREFQFRFKADAEAIGSWSKNDLREFGFYG